MTQGQVGRDPQFGPDDATWQEADSPLEGVTQGKVADDPPMFANWRPL